MNHRERYPEQYSHPLCGVKVRTKFGKEFIVFRVVRSRFGLLAMSEEDQDKSYLVSTLQYVSYEGGEQ